MIKLDENLLVELGLGALPKDEKTSFLKHMYETLEMRVGTRLAERMSDQQMSEFEQFITSNDEQGAFHWLESNFPNYKEVVAEEFEKLKGEIKPMAADILAASQAQQQQMPAGPQFPANGAGMAQPPQPQQGYAQAQPGQSGQGQPFQQPSSLPYDQPAPQQQYQQPSQQPMSAQQPIATPAYPQPQQYAQQMQQPQPAAPQSFGQQPPQMPAQQYTTVPQQPSTPGHHPQYPQPHVPQNPPNPQDSQSPQNPQNPPQQ